MSGKQRVRLGEDGIALYDSRETEQLTIGLLDGEPHIALGAGEDGSHRIRLVVEEGLPCITLLDEDETERVVVEVAENSFARLELFNKGGNRPAIALAADPDGTSTILLSGKNKLQVGCRVDGSGENHIIRIFDTSGKVIWSAP